MKRIGSTCILGFQGKITHEFIIMFSNGLSTVGYIFSKVLREPVKYLRSTGARLLTFVDDRIGVGVSFQEECEVSILIKNSVSSSWVFCLQIKSPNRVQVQKRLG